MDIGKTIRQLRLSQGMRIKELAQRTKLTSSLISQVEREVVMPSLTTLIKISQALQVPIVSFFPTQMDNSTVVIKKEQRKKIVLPVSHIVYHLLSPDRNRKIEFFLLEMTLAKGDDTQLVTHKGEECGYVIKGKIEVRLGEEKYILEEGDSIYFQSSIPHRFRNMGKEKSISIWAVTPPSF
jgi:transcriptional regulator with XRE-family HTH domain